MTAREKAREIVETPVFQELVKFLRQEAKRLGRGWCRSQAIRSLPRRQGDRVGALYSLDIAGILPRVEGGLNQLDPDVREWVLYALEAMLPSCGHQGRDGEPSLCASDYPTNGLEELIAKETGFKPLVERLRTAGEKVGK